MKYRLNVLRTIHLRTTLEIESDTADEAFMVLSAAAMAMKSTQFHQVGEEQTRTLLEVEEGCPAAAVTGFACPPLDGASTPISEDQR